MRYLFFNLHLQLFLTVLKYLHVLEGFIVKSRQILHVRFYLVFCEIEEMI